MTTHGVPLKPLECLYEDESLPKVPLPEELARLHDGNLGFPSDCLFANIVTTLDGVVAIPALPRSNDFVAGDSAAARCRMGLRRAFADVVLIGSGVLRASPSGTWQPERIFPPAARAYAELRETLGASQAPEIAVLTGSGAIDQHHPLLEWGAVVLTSDAGAERLKGSISADSTVVALGPSTWIEPRLVVDTLRERGHRRILSEAGPHTFGELLEAGLVDELFLTTSPLLVGSGEAGSRLRLVEGADLVPDGRWLQLLSLRRHGSHLFHRYGLERNARR
jgi:riboflavin biosynthesis pyrimidine reductase